MYVGIGSSRVAGGGGNPARSGPSGSVGFVKVVFNELLCKLTLAAEAEAGGRVRGC